MVDEKASPTFIFFAVIAIIASMFSLGLVYMSANSLLTKISGYVSSGETNLTVATQAEVNFTTRAIAWGSGRVTQDASAASLTTSNHSGIANVTGGNWTLTTTGGMRIENIGNVNVSLNLTISSNASSWIAGTNPVTEWNLTNLEANTCQNNAGSGTSGHMNVFYDTNTTPASAWIGGMGCAIFNFLSTKDSIRLDFNLTIPENSKSGALGEVITATVTAL
ncbi:MAG: hypothetical protein AABY16_02545 [Nanoarchaeota archaeon]